MTQSGSERQQKFQNMTSLVITSYIQFNIFLQMTFISEIDSLILSREKHRIVPIYNYISKYIKMLICLILAIKISTSMLLISEDISIILSLQSRIARFQELNLSNIAKFTNLKSSGICKVMTSELNKTGTLPPYKLAWIS